MDSNHYLKMHFRIWWKLSQLLPALNLSSQNSRHQVPAPSCRRAFHLRSFLYPPYPDLHFQTFCLLSAWILVVLFTWGVFLFLVICYPATFRAFHTLYHIHGQVCAICLANPVFATLCSVWLNKYLLSCSQIQFWEGFFFCFKIQKVSLNSGSLYSLRQFLNSLSHKWCCSSGLCNCKRKKSQPNPYTQHRN